MPTEPIRVVVGYDGSPSANLAIDAGALLLPNARCWVTHLWTPPFASESIRQRVWAGVSTIDDFREAIEREGAHEAEQIVSTGVILARAAGWDAEPLVRRSYGGEGLLFASIADEVDADLVLVGARGLSGTSAALGSVSDPVVRHTPRPVLVVPRPLLTDEYAALRTGPVLVGFDASTGAQTAVATANRLFPTRPVVLVAVDGDEATLPPEAEPAGAEVATIPAARRFGSHARAVADALAAYARQRQAAVLVVGSQGRSAAREILLGSVARATLHHAHRPVIVVPAPA
ncbi:MAG: universal stress protein [Micromonosporaceae bacterium]|nr:universal stress protein [Micromonosporaceae bacterium]